MNTPDRWDRMHWGVLFDAKNGGAPHLIGEFWWTEMREKFAAHKHDPTRPLMFTTRVAAREWASQMNAKYPHWRFRVVRVREIVSVEQ